MVDINDLKYFYKKEENIFSGLSLKLKPGNIYGLLGKNGAGKTTLLKIIAGILFPKEGNVKVFGEIPALRSPAFLSEIFYLPEEIYLPELTVKQLADFYSKLYPNFNYEQFNKAVNEFEISVEKSLADFSMGQRKRVLIAMAFAANTKILLLDEPTNGLDIPAKAVFRKMLSEAAAEDKIIFVSTHLVKDVNHLIDPVIILEKGKIIANSEIINFSRKLAIEFTSQEPEKGTCLYYEKIPSGYAVLIENEGGIEKEIDLEILFNAFHANDEIRNLIKEGAKNELA